MFYVVDQVLPDDYAKSLRQDIELLHDEKWDRYDNPFELKYVLQKPYKRPFAFRLSLLHMDVMKIACRVFPHFDLIEDVNNHFQAVFTYYSGHYLSLHLDADIEPVTKMNKAVTALLYLSTDDLIGGDLEFWSGTREAPQQRIADIPARFNTLVLFTNHQTAWHGNPNLVRRGTKIVITFSFMNNAKVYSRERAYFAPEPNEYWSPKVYEMRDQRADATEYAQLYRVGDPS